MTDQPETPSFFDLRDQWERQYWEASLWRCKGNISRMAKEARCDRGHVYHILARLKIEFGELHFGNDGWRNLNERRDIHTRPTQPFAQRKDRTIIEKDQRRKKSG